MKIAALCNSLMGIPALQSLAQSGKLVALGMPEVEHEATLVLRDLAPQWNIPLTVFNRTSFSEALDKWVRDSQADIVFVYTFPFFIKEPVLSLPRFGFLNFHFGLLPQYRGADAIFWEIRNREPFGACTVHKMESTADTGPIAWMQKIPINPTDTYGIHMGSLAMAAVQGTHQLVNMFEKDATNIPWTAQDETLAKDWPKPGQREVVINWNTMSSHEIIALVRACNPWNKGAYTFLGNNALRITVVLESSVDGNKQLPGTLLANPEGGIAVVCADEKCVSLECIYLDAGFFTGRELARIGIIGGMRFSTPPL